MCDDMKVNSYDIPRQTDCDSLLTKTTPQHSVTETLWQFRVDQNTVSLSLTDRITPIMKSTTINSRVWIATKPLIARVY